MHPVDSFDQSVEPLATRHLTADQKQRLTEVLDQYLSALETGFPPSREAVVAAHPDLARPLETYLDGLDELHDAAVGFGCLSRRATAEHARPADDEQRLGDFRLLREIGRGGMGVVYEAQQISLGRRVALKVLPFAAVLDARQIARFQHEAQAAARLDHPHIVSVFAVGVERGVHYYAMQFIDGQPLDRALAELRAAAGIEPKRSGVDTATKTFFSQDTPGGNGHSVCPPRDRTRIASEEHAPPDSREGKAGLPPAAGDGQTLDACQATCKALPGACSPTGTQYFRTVAGLGIQAAEALHAAHEHGVVHRDVKPSNLLLDGDGKLWVTDFGLARCQTDATLTRTGDLMGTLRYMSPEQATGQSALIDHRTDVYSLGVTLYELLGLEPAFPADDGPALLRRIETCEPRPLRQLQPRLPADLETVVSKAMAKRREDRYATARELAEDLQRVLDGKPTVARPATLPERLGKWARRHTRVVGTAAAVGLFALLGMAASMFLITRAKIEAQRNYVRAERRFREFREAVDCLGAHLAERLADVPGAQKVRRDLLQELLHYYRGFVEQASENQALRGDLALTYNKIGRLAAEIGSTDEAIEAYQHATRLYAQLAAENPGEPDHRRGLGVSQNNLARVLQRSGRTDAACCAFQDAIGLQKQLVESCPSSQDYLGDLALSYNNLGLLQSETGQTADAKSSFGQAIELGRQVLDLGPDDPERLRNLAASYNNLGALFAETRPEQAAEYYRKALEHQSQAAGLRPEELRYKSDLARTCENRGAALAHAGQLEEAAAAYARAVEIQTELAGAAPAQKAYRHDLAVSYNNLGLTQTKRRQTVAAEHSFRQAIALEESLVRQNPRDPALSSRLGGMYNNLGMVLQTLGRNSEAAQSYQRAIEYQQAARLQAPQVIQYREFLSRHYYNYGHVLRHLGRAEDAARAALARRELWPKDPQHLFAVAEEFALAAKALGSSAAAKTPADRCAQLAMETLRQAMAAGWKPSPKIDWTESFSALKDRPGFAELVRK
jgi:hypothetical protein